MDAPKYVVERSLVRAVQLFFLVLFGLFVTGAYNWAFSVYRTGPQNINPVMYPFFTEINVSAFAPTMREKYYRLWRTYDWVADGYASPRVDGVYSRVPTFYVHGNAGSYFCARSLARFVYESNARLRQNAVRNYRRHVKRQLFHEYRTNESLETLEEGMQIPEWLQRRVEEKVVREEVPLLGIELFSVDFLEESSTQAAPIILKEARFLNHSIHLVVSGFLRTYAEVLAAPPAPAFDRDTLDRNETDRMSDTATLSAPTIKLLKEVEREYSQSVCSHSSIPADEKTCQQAKQLTKRFSTLERARAEVQRVQQQGIWIWAESLGGVTALLAAIFDPHLYAGVVLVGTPVHYPPLFFDHASVWIYEVLNAAVLLRYPAPEDVQRVHSSSIDWAEMVADTKRPHELLYDLRTVPPAEISHRLRNLTLLSINGGTLDDVVPSLSGYLQRSTPRPPGTLVNRSSLVQEGGYRRDISTETLRGCGTAMDHRGLVYGLQFMKHAAESLVQASLLPNANKYFGREDKLPSLHRDRLFPSVVETLSGDRFEERQHEHVFVSSVRDSPSGKYVKETKLRALLEQLKEVCVESDVPIDYNDLPIYDEEDPSSGYYDETKLLNVLIGVSTLAPEQVLAPNIQLFYDEAHEKPVPDSEVRKRVATLLHLPTMYKGTKAIPGRTLQTAVSFAIYRRMKKRRQQTWIWPRFCILVDSNQGLGTTRLYLQYDKIDISVFANASSNRLMSPLLHDFGGEVHVHTQPGYALVRGVDSAMLEPQLQVRTDDAAEVFPFVMCGSLHSFYLALRGQDSLAPDEPEHQLQYFYGPFRENLHHFTYRWKPFSTYPPMLNETYLIYTLTDNGGARPEVLLPTYSMLQNSSVVSLEYWKWLLVLWPQRWLAVFSMYTGIARLGGSSVLFFFTLFFSLGIADEKLWMSESMQANVRQRSPFLRIRALPSLVAVPLIALVIEMVAGLWASTALRVCLSTDPPPYVTEAEMTARMSIWEKFTLVVLYGIWPSYRSCRFSWIRMQGAPVWSVVVEQVATTYLGFGISSVFLVILLIYLAVVGAVTWPLRRFVLLPLLRCAPMLLALLFALWWVVPTVLLFMCPAFPLCFVDIVGSSLLAIPVWMLPRWTRSGYNYRLAHLLMSVTCIFPSHFNGLILTIRNLVVMHDSPAALGDAERYTPSGAQLIVHSIMQAGLACSYVSLFCILRNEENLRMADKRKVSKDAKPASISQSESNNDYVLGDFGRRAPRLRSWIEACNTAFAWASLWVCIIAIRRPIEGGASLWGNMAILGYWSTRLLRDL
ncbi:hypothetical protein, conserved [Leishmania tarentolae]|uniref:GPI inositol-deacylase n=1 Tax=Leishmania tarentolae TaxID=5689 RepID=A0A640KTL5_LEITA|nr:hypothetical protein, conserved [Leishmania tarentolae]